MNLRQIEVLRALIRCETTVGAGQELGLSQPAVSNALKQLETQLGFALFERINNRLFPTEEARTIYAESEPIFTMHSALAARVRDLKEHRTGLVRIIATPPLGYSAVPIALKRFLGRSPKIRVFFDVRRFENTLSAVEDGHAELGFVMGLRDTPATLASETLFEGHMVCVMRQDHQLASRPVIRPSDLKNEPLIALEHGTRMGTLLRKAFAEASEVFSYAVEVRYANAACVLAENGIGVAVVDPLSAMYGHYPNLVALPFEPRTAVSASVVYSKKRSLSAPAQAFLQDMRLAVREATDALHSPLQKDTR
jgi:DNA-binding transcriptional LysR family regulator